MAFQIVRVSFVEGDGWQYTQHFAEQDRIKSRAGHFRRLAFGPSLRARALSVARSHSTDRPSEPTDLASNLLCRRQPMDTQRIGFARSMRRER